MLEIVVEVRRQFREIKGLMEGRAVHARCVDICTRVVQEMVTPTLVVVTVPVIVGLILNVQGVVAIDRCGCFRLYAGHCHVFSGGAWDNAKNISRASSRCRVLISGGRDRDTVGIPSRTAVRR